MIYTSLRLIKGELVIVRCLRWSYPLCAGTDQVSVFSRNGGTRGFRGGVISRKFTVAGRICCIAGSTARSTRGDFAQEVCYQTYSPFLNSFDVETGQSWALDFARFFPK